MSFKHSSDGGSTPRHSSPTSASVMPAPLGAPTGAGAPPTPDTAAELARLRAEIASKDAALKQTTAILQAVIAEATIPHAAEPRGDPPPGMTGPGGPGGRGQTGRGARSHSIQHSDTYPLSDEQLARQLQEEENRAGARAAAAAAVARQNGAGPGAAPTAAGDSSAVAVRPSISASAPEPSTTPRTNWSILDSLARPFRSTTPAAGSSAPTAPTSTPTSTARAPRPQANASAPSPAHQHRGRHGHSHTHRHHGRTDAEIAAALQQEEIMRAYARTGPPDDDGRTRVEDPVWGTFESPPGQPFKPHQVICIALCPCCVPPLCSPDRRSRYAQIARTAAFALSIIQILLWIVSLCFRGFAPTSVNSMVGPWPDTLDLLQAKNSAFIVYRYHLWRLVTPIFLHAGLIHLLMNLLMQIRAGLTLEYSWGTRIWLQLYFGAGIFASAFSAVLLPDQMSVGASGALMGIMGAWLVWLLVTWSEGDEYAQSQRSINLVLAFVNIVIIIGFSFVPYIDWAAHLFGLIGGILLGMWLFADGHIQGKRRQAAIRWIGLTLYLGMFLAALLGLFLNTTPNTGLLDICGSLRRFYPHDIQRCW